MFYVYLLRSLVDSRYYIGQSEDCDRRLERHNAGFVPATKHRRPLVLVGYEEFASRSEARFREFQLKKSSSERQKFYRKLD